MRTSSYDPSATSRVLSEAGRTVGPLLTGIGFGAALMYFLDPRLGRYRRGVARDRAVSFAHRSVVLAEKQALNARNHLRGALAEAQQLIRLEEPVSDRKLGERVRSRIGRVTPQASTIELDVHAGVVVAKGRLKREHAQRVLSAISRVRGVTAVKDRIERIPLQEG